MLLLVPYETSKEDVVVRPHIKQHLCCNTLAHVRASLTQVVIERDYLLAGVRGQQPVVKVSALHNILPLAPVSLRQA